MVIIYDDDPKRRIYLLERRIEQLEALVSEMAVKLAFAELETK